MQRLAVKWRRSGIRVGCVPTMGYLHAGHASLIRRARKLVGKRGAVVVSIYVNPAQFAPGEDLSRYPRDFKRDAELCRRAGADTIFFPDDNEMYPGQAVGNYSTFVLEETLSKSMEGESRPSHFRGVTTVVTKLFNIVLPDVAVFGAKDFQQAAVIRRMVKDLNFAVKIIVAPTIREPDGLAMSSRNKYLAGDQRRHATVLWKAIQRAREAVATSSNALKPSKLRSELKKLIEREESAHVDYVHFFEPETLEPVRMVKRGTQMAVAVFIGKTRLIDNATL